jgi:hypothetical protein
MKKIIAKLTPALKGMDPKPQGCLYVLVFVAALSLVSALVTAALLHH